MDNKQDRQFLWNVKDFLQKKPDAPVLKSDSLQNTIRQVTSNIPNVPVPIKEMVNSSSDLKNKVCNKINSYQSTLNNQKPKSIQSSNHITANPFRIK